MGTLRKAWITEEFKITDYRMQLTLNPAARACDKLNVGEEFKWKL